jgi:CRISPR/Cas system-associated exonuclease Cas4 (RecB family)
LRPEITMQSFIEQLAEEILANHKNDLDKLCIVFPTRRAGLFLKKELARRIENPIWSPTILSIQDFIHNLSPHQIPDQLTLLFELFSVYKRHLPNENFETFYTWGLQVLNDFDEIDRSLVSAKHLFKRILEIKEIEHEFQLGAEELQFLEEFWKTLSDKELSPVKNVFLETWELLNKVYEDFNASLLSKNQTYEGKAYRIISENIEEYVGKNQWDTILFAGFYALSRAEENIFSKLIDKGIAKVYLDADDYYLEDKKQEAGKFFVKLQTLSEPFQWKSNYLESIPKEITITAVPLQVGQAKAVGNDLKNLFNNKENIPDETAIVLADENLLFPVLSSLPDDIEHINVTMGYPLHSTPLFGLMEQLINLNKNSKKDVFYHRDVVNILNHPYIRSFDQEKINNWMRDYKKNNWIYITRHYLETLDSTILLNLFIKIEEVEDVFDYFYNILLAIRNNLLKNKDSNNNLETEFIYHFYTQLKRLQDIISNQDIQITLESFWKLFKDVIKTATIPFTGEPLRGLQVMGFLETRTMDFKNVFILSMNEGILPKKVNISSFIPYNLRKAFGIPTGEDQDAVFAYHFYRLLQRATNIFLYYNTEVKSITGGEKSRYLLQLEYELVKKYPQNIHLKKQLLTTEIINIETPPIIIPKDTEVMSILDQYLGIATEDTRHFSASALSSYIACSLRFYFNYIAGLKEQDEVEDDIEAATFGSIFHYVMQHIYEVGKEYNEADFEELKKNLERLTDEAIQVEYTDVQDLVGRNILLRNVLLELVNRVLEEDKRNAPFIIRGLEDELVSVFSKEDGQQVNFRGILDRVEEKDAAYRILDYKTGKVDLRDADIIEIFINPKHKFVFQTFFYAWLFHQKYPGEMVKTGIYPLRSLSDGILWLNKGSVISNDEFNVFEEELKSLINRLYNKDIPFAQTDDEEQCKYCPYKGICNR